MSKGRDAKGNHCIYLQDGLDRQSRELYKSAKQDARIFFSFQFEDYLDAAQKEADERNAKDD